VNGLPVECDEDESNNKVLKVIE
jgi:hypothetical protein